MAKKQKKRSASMVAEAVVNETAAAPRVAGVSRFSTEFNPDYAYVKQDLKRIGILAGSFFIVLVVLSFFLR